MCGNRICLAAPLPLPSSSFVSLFIFDFCSTSFTCRNFPTTHTYYAVGAFQRISNLLLRSLRKRKLRVGQVIFLFARSNCEKCDDKVLTTHRIWCHQIMCFFSTCITIHSYRHNDIGAVFGTESEEKCEKVERGRQGDKMRREGRESERERE